MSRQAAARFSNAASRYEQSARVQQQAAVHFDAWLAELQLPTPSSIAEIGCGTGLFTRLLQARYPQAMLHATDLAPAMVELCRNSLPPSDKLQFSVCDGRDARFDPASDWIVSAMCFQWFDPLLPVLQRHLSDSRMLAFSILLDGSFAAWRTAHQQLSLTTGLRPLPDYDALLKSCSRLPASRVHAQRISLNDVHPDGLSFAHSLRAIGADMPRAGHQPVNLRRVFRQLEKGITANYEIGFFCLER